MLLRLSFIVLLSTALSACFSLDNLTRNNDDRSFYLVDRELRFYCDGNTPDCMDMTKIVSARAMLNPIEEAYQQEIKGPNYPVSLMHLILNPPDGAYHSQPIGDAGRFFSIPKTDRTNLVWHTLDDIMKEHYNTPGS